MSRMEETINRLKMARKARFICNVYETDDYSIFRGMEHNRDVVMSRVRKLVASFNEKEILNPIVVNEKMEIIDGQGRYEALKLLKRPIKFIIAENATIDDCRRMNAYNTNWSTMDFVKSYAASKNKNYMRLLDCYIETGISFTRMLQFAGIESRKYHGKFDTDQRWYNSKIGLGEIVFTEEHFKKVLMVNKMSKDILDALTITSKQGLNTFYKCIPVVFNYDGYNHERMVKKCNMCRSSFRMMGSMVDMLTEFSRVYNYKTTSSEKLYFQDYMRNKGHNVRNYDEQYIDGYDSKFNAKTLVVGNKDDSTNKRS